MTENGDEGDQGVGGDEAATETPAPPKPGVPTGEHINLDYWHGLLPNEDTINMLKNDGEFLLRAIEGRTQFNIFMSIRAGSQVLNGPIVANGNQFEFQGHLYDTIKDAIDFHQIRKTPVTIRGQQAILEFPIRRKAWELRHFQVQLGKKLGSGSYGTVYKGVLTVDLKKTNVAIKVLTEMNLEASKALWKEARFMMQCDHVNVIKLYGVANDVMPFFLVMELVDGGSVDRYLEKKGSWLSTKNRANILLEAAYGIDYLHSKDCIHRDIATRNLLIAKVVKVADFGMTRRSTKYKVDPNKPMNLRWLAPEVFKTSIVNKQTDVYAYGVTMYEVFKVPFGVPYPDWGPNKVYEKVVEKGYRLSPPPKMPKCLGALMVQCIGNPEDRPDFRRVISVLLKFIAEGDR